MLGDNDAGEMLDRLAPPTRNLVFTIVPTSRAPASAELPALVGTAHPEAPILIEPAPTVALDRALALGADTLVLYSSIFLVGELRAAARALWGCRRQPSIWLSPKNLPLTIR